MTGYGLACFVISVTGIAFGVLVFISYKLGHSYAALAVEPDLEAERLASLKRAYASTDMTLDEFEEQVAQALNGVQPAVHASAGFSVNPYRVIGQHPDISWQPGSGYHSHGTVSACAAYGTAMYYPPRDLRAGAAMRDPGKAGWA